MSRLRFAVFVVVLLAGACSAREALLWGLAGYAREKMTTSQP